MPLAFGNVDAEYSRVTSHVDALLFNAVVIVEYGVHLAAHEHDGLT